MGKKDKLTKTSAIIGTVFVWLPILAPVFFTVVLFLSRRMLRFDFLMPAELFLFALIGGMLLLLAAFRPRKYWKNIAWALGIAILSLAGSQGLAVITGLAHGTAKPAGWRMAIVLALLGVYTLSVVWIGITGVKLLKRLFKTAGSKTGRD